MESGPSVIIVEPTRDPAEYAESLLPVTPLLKISATATRFQGSAKLVPLERMALFLPKVAHAKVEKPIVEDLFTLNLPLDEPMHCRIGCRYETIEPGSAYLAGPGSEVDLRTGATPGTLALNIDAELLRSHWMGPDDTGPTGETRAISLRNPNGRALFQALSDAWRDALRGPITTAHRDELGDRITLALACALAGELTVHAAEGDSRRILRRAKGYIDAHLRSRITVPDIVRAAGASSRTLHRVFLKEEGLTPMQFVASERLNAVRRVLMRSDPHEVTVTQVAVDHGFGHLGRFSIAYRSSFGERPSTTLRG